MTTGVNLVERALKIIGRLGGGQTINANDQTDGLAEANAMLDFWNAQGLVMPYQTSCEVAFATARTYYTIGASGANLTAPRPIRLDAANYMYVGSEVVRYPMDIINAREYSKIRVRGLESTISRKVYYKPTYPNGTLYFWPYVTVVTDYFEAFYPAALTALSSSDISLQPGYEDAIVWNLAERLTDYFGMELTQNIVNRAQKGRVLLEHINTHAIECELDVGGGDEFDYLTGGFA